VRLGNHSGKYLAGENATTSSPGCESVQHYVELRHQADAGALDVPTRALAFLLLLGSLACRKPSRDVGNVADEPSTLSVRLEALELVSEGAGDISLPVLQVEFAGNEVGILYDGSGIGTGWIRVQMRPETFARLGHRASVGERLVMQIVPDAPCFSTQQAEG
jgi:hypothetical protein